MSVLIPSYKYNTFMYQSTSFNIIIYRVIKALVNKNADCVNWKGINKVKIAIVH